MSQPPLTENIQILEQALKVKLFDRSRKGAQLTSIGAAILPAVRKFADQMDNLEFAVTEAIAGQKGTMTIGAISFALFNELPPVLDKLRCSQPDVTIAVKEIDSVDAVPLLMSGEIDVAFARLEGEVGNGIKTMPLAEDRLAVALPVTHPLAKSARVRLASLAEEDFVMFSREVSPVYFDCLTAACRASGFAPRILHEVRTVSSQTAFVGCGQGIALIPHAMKKIAPQNVVVRPLKEVVNVITMAVAWDGTRENLMVKKVIEALSPVKKGRN
ncbi:DNA-binding transcriptional LysR family regulator [Herbaspirillum sp. 1130]|nr:DNA-binding transcriptional LysR family regulator [Herbaspirillum sp. 1130]